MGFWGTIGKIGAGIAAPFTGGASLLAIPAIGAVEGGMKGGLKGALTGAAGGGIDAFLGGGGDFISKDVGKVADAINGSNSTPGSFIDSILKKVPGANKAADIGNVLGGFAEGEANNRLQNARLMQGYDQLMLHAAANRRADESDAMRKLYQTSYVMGGGRPYQASAASPYSFGFGPAAPSMAMQAGSQNLQKTLLDRLGKDGSYTPAEPKYADRGLLEKIANYGGAISAGIGAVRQPKPYILNQQSYGTPVDPNLGV